MSKYVLDLDKIHAALAKRGWVTDDLFDAMTAIGYEGGRRSIFNALGGVVDSPNASTLKFMARCLGLTVDSMLRLKE